MIKYPIPLKQMVFLKRLWEELWEHEETPNITYDVPMVHSGKRDLVFDVQVLFLDALGIGRDLPKYRYQDWEKIRQNKLLELLVDKQQIQTVNEVRAEQTGEPILDSNIKTSEDARKCLDEHLKKQGSDFDREVC